MVMMMMMMMVMTMVMVMMMMVTMMTMMMVMTMVMVMTQTANNTMMIRRGKSLYPDIFSSPWSCSSPSPFPCPSWSASVLDV